jgi:hypothetical protein
MSTASSLCCLMDPANNSAVFNDEGCPPGDPLLQEAPPYSAATPPPPNPGSLFQHTPHPLLLEHFAAPYTPPSHVSHPCPIAIHGLSSPSKKGKELWKYSVHLGGTKPMANLQKQLPGSPKCNPHIRSAAYSSRGILCETSSVCPRRKEEPAAARKRCVAVSVGEGWVQARENQTSGLCAALRSRVVCPAPHVEHSGDVPYA